MEEFLRGEADRIILQIVSLPPPLFLLHRINNVSSGSRIRIKDQRSKIKDQRSRIRGEKKQVTPICPQLMVFNSFLLLEPFPLCEAFSIWLSLKRIAWGFGYIGISLLKALGFLGIFGCFYSFCCWYLFHYASLSLSGFWSLKRIAWGFEYIGISLLEGFLTCICICHLLGVNISGLGEQIHFTIWTNIFWYLGKNI